MSAVWLAPLASQGEFAWVTRFPERNSGQKSSGPQTGVETHARLVARTCFEHTFSERPWILFLAVGHAFRKINIEQVHRS